MMSNLIGYDPQDTIIHRLSGATKLIGFLVLSIIGMISYDTRFILSIVVFSLFLFKLSHIRYRQIVFTLKFILFFSLLNLIAVYLFSPEYGVSIYGTRHVLWEGIGRYTLTQEQLFYELNLLLKYLFTVPLALIFLLTTDPSEFAASLNKIGISYRISYAISLSLRYIPDVQNDYRKISMAQQARGYELSKKNSLIKRLKGAAQIILPLIFSSLDRIDTISHGMELRRFGKEKKRTWYKEQKFEKNDFVALTLLTLFVGVGLVLFGINKGRFYNPFH